MKLFDRDSRITVIQDTATFMLCLFVVILYHLSSLFQSFSVPILVIVI